jgi:hypothetical protein
MSAEVEQFVGDGGRNAEAGRGVFAVYDHQIDMVLINNGVEFLRDNSAAGLADDITHKEQSHVWRAFVRGKQADWRWLP